MSEATPQQVFLGRQPILDRNQQLFAYELLFRSAAAEEGNFARFADGNQATAQVIVNAFGEFSLADALGHYPGFIKVDRGLLFSDLIYALPQHCVVLEILDTVAPTQDVTERCEALCGAGYVLAVRERPESLDQSRPLLRLAEVIKLDVARVDPERLEQLAASLKPLGKTLLAERVERVEDMARCRELGFDLFQGYYFARPTVISGKRLQSSEVALLRLLGLLSQDADGAAIENAFKEEPILTVNLLRLTNSAGAATNTRITSLRHAIILLGRRQLLRWLQLLLYSGFSGVGPTVTPLLQLAATRGRLMELLVDQTPAVKVSGRELIDQAYMVGILSLLPTLMHSSMDEVLARLPLARPVHDALSTRSGTLGDLLSLVEALEGGSEADDEKVAEKLARLEKIDAACASRCLAQALAWANMLAREEA